MALASADTYVVVVALPDMMAGVGLGLDELQRATPIISGVGMPLGVVGAVQELGSVLGPLLGAAVLVVADWRAIFWLNVALGILVAAVLVLVAGPDSRPRPRLLPTLLFLTTLAAGLLTLVAPAALVNRVTLGIPFVPFAGTSRLATPMGVSTLLLLLACLWSMTSTKATRVSAPSGSQPGSGASVWRRVDLPGALCIAVALGSLVLTFASADPEREVVGSLGWSLGLLAVAAYLWRHRTARDPLLPRGLMTAGGGTRTTRTSGRISGHVPALAPALIASILAGVALVAVVVDVPLLARLTMTGSQTTSALLLVRFLIALPVGALLGGWLLRRLGPAVLAARSGCTASTTRWKHCRTRATPLR